MKKLSKHFLIIMKLLVLLLFTVNDTEFEFRPFLDHILNKSYIMRLVALYVLCLTYIISVEENLDIWDYVDAFISTAFFLLFITPDDIKKTNKDTQTTSINIDKLTGLQ